MSKTKRPIVCLTGPTAAGKTAATQALAQRWPIEIISVDSATIYRSMDIGTAKPSLAERQRLPHHLIDILDPAASYSAAQFSHDALQLIEEIQQRDHWPVLSGGTMLYYKALREGLNELPEADPLIRSRLDADAANRGWPALHNDLAQIDPETAQRLAPNDSQRIQRALEIYHISGKTMSALLRAQRENPASHFQFATVSLEPSDRLILHERISERFDQMLSDGLLAEVEKLYRRDDLHTGLPSIRCVGYRQIWSHLDGEISLEEATKQAKAATRQLAKRQLTWLRSQPKRQIIDCLSDDAASQVIDAVAALWENSA